MQQLWLTLSLLVAGPTVIGLSENKYIQIGAVAVEISGLLLAFYNQFRAEIQGKKRIWPNFLVETGADVEAAKKLSEGFWDWKLLMQLKYGGHAQQINEQLKKLGNGPDFELGSNSNLYQFVKHLSRMSGLSIEELAQYSVNNVNKTAMCKLLYMR